MDIENRTALVTGAYSGLNKAVTRALAARGARVLMVARSRRRGEATRDELRAATGNTQVGLLACDLASRAQVRTLADDVRERTDAVALPINNAGTALGERGRMVQTCGWDCL